MKLVILYGAPAVGKLTVASLMKKHGYVVFDNHQVIDLIEPIVTRQYRKFRSLVYDTQIELLLAAVKSNSVDVVTTFPYASNEGDDNDFMDRLISQAEEFGAKVRTVHLVASKTSLMSRVSGEGRTSYGKITDDNVLGEVLDSYDFDTDYSNTTIHIDTSEMSSAETADQIIETIGHS